MIHKKRGIGPGEDEPSEQKDWLDAGLLLWGQLLLLLLPHLLLHPLLLLRLQRRLLLLLLQRELLQQWQHRSEFVFSW